MENSPRFDLNELICAWRNNMFNSPAFRPEDMDELETHLRDSIMTLEAKGLSAQEAFWVARNRLGSTESLDLEFGKTNAKEVFLNRLLWIVAGWLTIHIVFVIASVVEHFATLSIYNRTGFQHYLGPASLLVNLGTVIGLFYWGWRSGNKHFGLVPRLDIWVRAHPWTTALIVFLFVAILQQISLRIKGVPSNERGWMEYIRWRMPIFYFQTFLGPLMLGWLLLRRSRLTATNSKWAAGEAAQD